MISNFKRLLCLVPLSVFLGSCSEDGLNEHVEAKMFPESPQIVSVDSKLGTGDDAEDIIAPWFVATFEIKNKHPDYTLVIPSLAFDYKGVKNGEEFEGTGTLTADDICEDGDRTQYAVIPALTTFTGDPVCDLSNSATEILYIHGLPGKDEGITSFQIKVTFEGYFFDSSNAQDPIQGRVKLIRYYMSH